MERVTALLAAELPPGTARADVEAWLDRHHFWHAPVVPAEDAPRSKAQDAGLVLDATLDDVPVDWFNDGEIDVEFFFDAKGRLVSQKVQAYAISL